MFGRILGVAILVAGVGASGCGSSKSGGSSVTGPGGDTPTDPTAVALDSAFGPVESNLITPNAALYSSVGAMGAHIVGVLGAPAANAGPSECIPAKYNGVTFDFNGSSYVATSLPGAPANGPRFLLYPLNAQGVPVLGTSNGHLDFTCEGSPTASPQARSYSISLLVNSTVVVSANMTADVGNTIIDGTLSNPAGTVTVPFSGQLYESAPGSEYESMLIGPYSGLQIQHDRVISTSNATVHDRLMLQPTPSPQWIVEAQLNANLAHAVSNGGLLVSGPQLLNALAACISGSLGAPVFAPQQTANCNFTPNGGTMNITNADARTYQDVYREARRSFTMFQALVRTVHQPLPPS